MIFQFSEEAAYHLFDAILISIMIALVWVFTIHTFRRYIKYRNKPALYLTLNYISYIVALILYFLANVNVVITGMETQQYIDFSMAANVFVLLGMAFAISLYDQFSKLKRWIYWTSVILGLLFSVFIISQFFILGFESLRLRISIYIVMASYGFAIYGSLALLFYRAFRKTQEKKKQLASLVIGNFLWIVHFTLSVIYGVTRIDLIEIVANFVMIIIFTCYFLGLFFFPKQKRGT